MPKESTRQDDLREMKRQSPTKAILSTGTNGLLWFFFIFCIEESDMALKYL